MRKIEAIIIIIVMIISLSTSASSTTQQNYDLIVGGKNNPEYDIKAVQEAIDKGGIILLKGTFDFGDKGQVKIKNDVDIMGELDSENKPLTKIKGGFWTFQSTLPEQLPPSAPGPKITIQGIHFEGALWNPIFLPYCGGAKILNNKITKVRPIEATVFGKEGMYRQQGISLVPLYTLPKEHRKYQPGLITGTITIADNDIDLSNDIPEKTMAQGVLIIGATGANTQILRNRVVNCSRNSLESLDNYPGEDGSGMTIFKENVIVTADKGIPLPTPATPNGIIAGWFLDMAGATDPARLTKIVATENQIETRGNRSAGIVILSDGAIITSNHILLKGGPEANGVFHGTSDSVIANNKIEGNGTSAVMLRAFAKLKPRQNVVFGNDFTLFKASMADVLLGGSGNLVLEKNGKIVDEGQMNLIIK